MVDNLHIIDPTQYTGWDDLILSHSNCSFFHTSSWAKVLKGSYGYTPLYFTVFEKGGISALFPFMEVNSFLTGRRGVSLPFTDYCEPILNNTIQFQDLLSDIIDYGKKRKWKSIEIRNGNDDLPLTSPSTTYLGHDLDLSKGESEILSGFRDSTKRNVVKALKEKVKAEIFTSFESVRKFYELNCLTRKNHGLPPQPFLFFKEIFQNVISRGQGIVNLASYKGKYVAGAIFFHFGKNAIYKYGASDSDYQHLRANNLVMWEAIKWYSQKGYKSLSLGRTEPENEGLIQFKSGLRPTPHPITYYRYDLKKNSYVSVSSRVTGFQNKIFKMMPLSLLTKTGGLLYKHIG